MFFYTNIVFHSVIVIALILRSSGLENAKLGKDKGGGLAMLNSTVLTTELEAKFDDLQMLRQVCPNNYCNDKQKGKPDIPGQETEVYCCIVCECGDHCFELGNCCYDKYQLANPANEEETEICTQASITNSNVKTMPTPVSYMLYQSCADTTNASLVSKCNIVDTKSMDEFIPVYSATTGRNYRNKYCAECNKDVDELVAWNCDVQCQTYMDFIILFDLQNLQDVSLIHWLNSEYLHCALHLNAPENSKPTRCLHPRDIIDGCDILSPLFSLLEDKCRTYYSPIYTKHFIFKNVFCMMCNENLRPLEEAFCDMRGYGESFYRAPIIRLLTFWKSNPSAILYDTSNRSSGCLPPLVFDEEINSCIEISCPIMTLPAGDLCYPLFKSLSNGHLDFRVIVKMSGFFGYDDRKVIEEVWALFKNQYSKENVCKSKIKKIYAVELQLHFVVQIIITISEQTDIKEAFDLFVNNIDQYGKDAGNLLKMEVAKAAVFPITAPSPILQFVDDYDEECDAIAMTDLMFCRTIVISNFERFGNNTLLANGLLFYPGDYVEDGFGKFHACLDTYLLKHKISQRKKNQFNGFGSQLINSYYVFIHSLLVYAASKMYT